MYSTAALILQVSLIITTTILAFKHPEPDIVLQCPRKHVDPITGLQINDQWVVTYVVRNLSTAETFKYPYANDSVLMLEVNCERSYRRYPSKGKKLTALIDAKSATVDSKGVRVLYKEMASKCPKSTLTMKDIYEHTFTYESEGGRCEPFQSLSVFTKEPHDEVL